MPEAPEVELPHSGFAVTHRQIARVICKGQAQLNELEHVYIDLESLLNASAGEGRERVCVS